MASNSMPDISIGLPVYNGGKFLTKSIEAILGQTFVDFELIISDNASTDNTQSICEFFQDKDSRIRYYRQEINLGPIKNFEFVLNKARGKYFMWFAADDSAKSNFIESLYNAIISNPSFVLVMSDVENISDTDEHLYVTQLKSIRIADVITNWKQFRNQFFDVPTSNIFFCIYGLYVTEIIKKVELNYKEKVKYATASEIPILAQVSSHGMIGSIEGALKVYRRHNESVYNNEQSSVRSNSFQYSNQRNTIFVLFNIIVFSVKFTLYEKIILMFRVIKNFISLTVDFFKNEISMFVRYRHNS